VYNKVYHLLIRTITGYPNQYDTLYYLPFILRRYRQRFIRSAARLQDVYSALRDLVSHHTFSFLHYPNKVFNFCQLQKQKPQGV